MRFATALLCLGLIVLVGRAQQATPEDKTFFDKSFGQLVTTVPTPITGDELDKVFAARFFTVKVSIGNTADVLMLVTARVGDRLSDISLPPRTADMPALKSLLKPDFKLKTDADGKAFEAALDLLYPPDTRYDEKRKAVKHAGNEWSFIRGVYIEDFKGLVVTTAADGAITGIKFSREIKN